MLTKPDIIHAVSYDLGYSTVDATELVDKVFDVITESLLKEEDVAIQGLMKLQVVKRPARRFRNQMTGKMETTKPGKRVKLKMSTVFRSKIDAAYQNDKGWLKLRDYDELYKAELPEDEDLDSVDFDDIDEPDEADDTDCAEESDVMDDIVSEMSTGEA